MVPRMPPNCPRQSPTVPGRSGATAQREAERNAMERKESRKTVDSRTGYTTSRDTTRRDAARRDKTRRDETSRDETLPDTSHGGDKAWAPYVRGGGYFRRGCEGGHRIPWSRWSKTTRTPIQSRRRGYRPPAEGLGTIGWWWGSLPPNSTRARSTNERETDRIKENGGRCASKRVARSSREDANAGRDEGPSLGGRQREDPPNDQGVRISKKLIDKSDDNWPVNVALYSVLASTNLPSLHREHREHGGGEEREDRTSIYRCLGGRELSQERDNRHRMSSRNGNSEEISVLNLVDGESLCYSLALIRGRTTAGCDSITVRNQKSQSTSEWPIVAGEFRAVVELARGPNKLELEAAGRKKKLLLIHEPRTTRLRVTPVYVICAGHDGYFQGPRGEDRSPESAATRIGLGARLLQALTAEKLREAGYERKTFQLERDLDGPECLVMHSMLDVDRARAMSQRELWELIARELMTGPLASKHRKYLAFLSCTRYRGAPNPRTHEDTLARTQGHAALGGGGLALFGSACLHTWPTCMNQVLARFLDATVVDTEQLMDDSNYRGTHGGCFATTLGSVLHELGHTFDLGHTREGIMGRGFDYVDRVFVGAAGIDFNRNPVLRKDPQHTTVALSRPLSVTVTVQQPFALLTSPRRSRLLSETSRPAPSQSPPRLFGRLSAPASPELNRSFSKSLLQAQSAHAIEQACSNSQTDRTFWTTSCAAFLAYHRWFNSEVDNIPNRRFYDIEYDGKRNVVRSRFGVRVIELRETSGGMVCGFRQFPGTRPPLEALVPPAPPQCLVALTLVAEDSAGNVLKYPLPTAF